MTAERHTAILHKNFGWIEAEGDTYFIERGKMVYLCDDREPEPKTFYSYPFGTSWRASSILAFSS